jgi:hypothetical protein
VGEPIVCLNRNEGTMTGKADENTAHELYGDGVVPEDADLSAPNAEEADSESQTGDSK